MPFQPHDETIASVVPAPPPRGPDSGWRHGLPVLSGSLVTLRELRATDAASLLAAMAPEESSRFISPPPSTVAGFEKFIAWAHRERAAGRSISLAAVARGSETALGLFQVRALDGDFATAEWGCAIDLEYWGTGMFEDGARLMIDFSFDVVGAHRLEARAALANSRGNGALGKLGAVQESVLRRSFLRNGEYLDQALWTILADEWRQARSISASRVIH